MAIKIPEEMYGKYRNNTGHTLYINLSNFIIGETPLNTLTAYELKNQSWLSITDIKNMPNIVEKDVSEFILWMKQYYPYVVEPDIFSSSNKRRPKQIQYSEGLI